MAETELEEGEACHYKDDASIDPDIALSYIDEKLQSVLGHFQKDFEGGVSAENLGAKFGGYGSFLPTHQRFPSIWSQPKSPQRLQNHITPRSPNNLPVEGAPQNSRALSVSPLTQRLGTASHSSHSLHTTRVQSVDVSVNKDCISSCQVAEELPLKHESSSSKPDKQTDPKTLKVRIKVGSDNTARKNAAIYSGLGLISPSSSMENSPEENDGVPLEPQEILDESAARILQIMTSFPVPGGLLLSPLHDRLICLIRKEKLSRNSKPVTTKTLKEAEKGVSMKRKENNKDNTKDRLLNGDTVKEEYLKSISCQDGGKCDKQEAKNSSLEKILENGARSADKDISVGRREDGNKISGPLKDEFDFLNSKRGRNVGATDCLKQKNGQKAIPHEHDEIKVAHGMEKLSYESQKKSTENQINSKLAANIAEESLMAGPEYKEKTIKDHNLKSQKDICKVRNDYRDVSVDTRLENKSIQMGPLERPSGDKVKDSNLEIVEKEGPEFFDRLKERPGCAKVDNKLTSGTVLKEEPDVGPPTGYGLASELKESLVAPVIILDNWVCCDRCEKWRLLPFGMDSDQLPDKWLCSMLNWLPAGMNSCDVSEEETTKALNALYQLPVPESQNNLQNHADRAATEVGSADQNRMHFSSNAMPSQGKKKHVSKRTSSAASCERKLQISNSTKNLRQEEVKSRSLNDMNQRLPESNLISNSNNIQNLSKSCNFATEKHTHKEKEKHESGGVSKKKRLKNQIEADQHGYASRKKIKTEGTTNTDKYWTSEHGGKMGLSVSTELPTKPSGKNFQKHCEDYYSNDSMCKQKNRAQVSVKKLANSSQVSLDGGSLGLKRYDEREISVKKRKLKDWQESQNYLETSQSNAKHISDNKASVKESSIDFEFRKQKKSKGRITRILLSGSRDNPSFENGQQPRKLEAKVASKQASDDANSLKRGLGSEQFSMAATSSSSKVSDSRKTKAGFQEVNGSPVESVSSSPMRTSNLGNSDGKICNLYVVHSPRKSMDGDANVEYRSGTRKDKVSGVFHPESLGFSTLDFRDKKSSHKLGAEAQCLKPSSEFGNTHLISNPLFTQKSGKSSSLQSRDNNRSSGSNFGRFKIKVSDPLNEHEEENIKKKLRGGAEIGSKAVKDDNNVGEGDTMACVHETVPRSQQASDIGLLPVDALGGGDVSKILRQPRNALNGHGISHNLGIVSSIRCGVGDMRAPSPLRKDAFGQAASDTLKEAEDLRDCADRLKNSGFGFECNEAYFQAALKFLHGASLLETCNSGSSKHGEITQLQIYSSAAKLCEVCAHEYEKRQEMAAAALAYKCMEVAYMRIVYCKNATTSRDRHDLQASVQMVPQGESPSSSASDIDNLNNQPMVDKAALSKGITSHAGNHIISARNRPNLIRLLDLTNDVSSAMEASRKSHKAYVAANLVMEEAQNKDGIISLKRVIDFSFQDIEELVRLVKLAIEAINRQGFSGGKD